MGIVPTRPGETRPFRYQDWDIIEGRPLHELLERLQSASQTSTACDLKYREAHWHAKEGVTLTKIQPNFPKEGKLLLLLESNGVAIKREVCSLEYALKEQSDYVKFQRLNEGVKVTRGEHRDYSSTPLPTPGCSYFAGPSASNYGYTCQDW